MQSETQVSLCGPTPQAALGNAVRPALPVWLMISTQERAMAYRVNEPSDVRAVPDAPLAHTARVMLNKVPEVTVFFWIIKILCTTVGETFADFLNDNLGLGLIKTMVLMSIGLAVMLVLQFRSRRYVPVIYWVSVVFISVVGTLITDYFTDERGVRLQVTTAVFSIILAIVFALWYASERTLSIHTIVTTKREAFYWLAVLFTFALGTAAHIGACAVHPRIHLCRCGRARQRDDVVRTSCGSRAWSEADRHGSASPHRVGPSGRHAEGCGTGRAPLSARDRPGGAYSLRSGTAGCPHGTGYRFALRPSPY